MNLEGDRENYLMKKVQRVEKEIEEVEIKGINLVERGKEKKGKGTILEPCALLGELY